MLIYICVVPYPLAGPQEPLKPMRHKPSLLLLSIAAVLGLAPAFAAVTPPPASATFAVAKDVQPESHDALVDQVIAGILQRYQYAHRPLDDKQSALIFDQYLQDLDGGKSYFTQA